MERDEAIEIVVTASRRLKDYDRAVETIEEYVFACANAYHAFLIVSDACWFQSRFESWFFGWKPQSGVLSIHAPLGNELTLMGSHDLVYFPRWLSLCSRMEQFFGSGAAAEFPCAHSIIENKLVISEDDMLTEQSSIFGDSCYSIASQIATEEQQIEMMLRLARRLQLHDHWRVVRSNRLEYCSKRLRLGEPDLREAAGTHLEYWEDELDMLTRFVRRNVPQALEYVPLIDFFHNSGEIEPHHLASQARQLEQQLLNYSHRPSTTIGNAIFPKNASAVPNRTRGPKLRYDAKQDDRLLRDWSAAKNYGRTRKEFESDKGLKPGDIARAQARQNKRKRTNS